jgi:hypothetical protein
VQTAVYALALSIRWDIRSSCCSLLFVPFSQARRTRSRYQSTTMALSFSTHYLSNSIQSALLSSGRVPTVSFPDHGYAKVAVSSSAVTTPTTPPPPATSSSSLAESIVTTTITYPAEPYAGCHTTNSKTVIPGPLATRMAISFCDRLSSLDPVADLGSYTVVLPVCNGDFVQRRSGGNSTP